MLARLLVIAVLGLICSSSFADGTGKGASNTADDSTTVASPETNVTAHPSSGAADLRPLPPDITDGSFDRYVDISSVGNALRSQDASLLIDAALQLSEGERILLRNHKSGITSKSLLSKAVIACKEDATTLDRLTKAAERLNDKELVTDIQKAKKLGGSSRNIGGGLKISPDNTEIATFFAIKQRMGSIDQAVLLNDKQQLDEIKQSLADDNGITGAARDELKKRIDEVSATVPDVQKPEDAAMKKLLEGSRGLGIGGGILDNTPFDPDTWPSVDPSQFVHLATAYHVYLKNNTNEPISVAFGCYRRVGANGGKTVYDWVFSGWYNLSPYERAFMGPVEGRNIYVYAKSKNLQWGGNFNHNVWVGQNIVLPFKHVDMGKYYNKFTYTFNR